MRPIFLTGCGWPTRLIAGWFVFLVAAAASAQPPPTRSSGELAAEIRNAAADQLYAVDLALGRAASVGEIRAVSGQLRIPRTLAIAEYAYAAGQGRGVVVIGLGEMYAAADAKEHSECQALLMVAISGQNTLQNRPIDDWPVSKMHVYATAHVIRELTAGQLLAATILSGGTAEREHLRKLETYVRDEASQPITKPSTVALPPYCARFLGSMDTPVLAGEMPPDLRQPDDETFREHAFRILAQQRTDTAVTINLKLNFPANVEALAALVQQYDIRGLRADLVPEHTSKRVIADAQLSVYGAAPAAQVHRARCQMRLGGEQPQASSEWYADWVSVSLSREAAVRFLSYPNLAQAQIAGIYPLPDLERLRGYYDRLATQVYEVPKSIAVPEGCGDVYVVNDQLDAGGVFFGPSP